MVERKTELGRQHRELSWKEPRRRARRAGGGDESTVRLPNKEKLAAPEKSRGRSVEEEKKRDRWMVVSGPSLTLFLPSVFFLTGQKRSHDRWCKDWLAPGSPLFPANVVQQGVRHNRANFPLCPAVASQPLSHT